jgi:hypothetical protein
MMGSSGTLSDKSALTVIFWPAAGTLMCWYMENVSGLDWNARLRAGLMKP